MHILSGGGQESASQLPVFETNTQPNQLTEKKGLVWLIV
jgi:hypothetical protein